MKAKPKIPITFQPDDRVVQASQGDTILSAALSAKLELSHSCGGNGTCGTCRIFVDSGIQHLGPRNEVETEIASERGFLEHERLACQNLVVAGLQVRIPKT